MESNWFKEMFINEAKSAANSRNGVTDDQIENAVTEYLYENPVEHPTQVSAFENDAGYAKTADIESFYVEINVTDLTTTKTSEEIAAAFSEGRRILCYTSNGYSLPLVSVNNGVATFALNAGPMSGVVNVDGDAVTITYYNLALSEDIPTDEHINDLIEDYMEENPVEASGGVKSVNGVEPDENGNVEIEIPGSSQVMCLPVVELSTPIAPYVTLTEAESAALTAAAQNKQCPIMKFQYFGIDAVAVATLIIQSGEYDFIVQVFQSAFEFTHADSDSPWSVVVTELE